jgi:hypothetical protein
MAVRDPEYYECDLDPEAWLEFMRAALMPVPAIGAGHKRVSARDSAGFCGCLRWSERRDLNSGPPVPQTGALTGLRYAPTERKL